MKLLPLPAPVVVGPPQRVLISIIAALEQEDWEGHRPVIDFLRALWQHGREQGHVEHGDLISTQLRLDIFSTLYSRGPRRARRLLVVTPDDAWSPVIVQAWSRRRMIVTVVGVPDHDYAVCLPHDLHVVTRESLTRDSAAEDDG